MTLHHSHALEEGFHLVDIFAGSRHEDRRSGSEREVWARLEEAERFGLDRHVITCDYCLSSIRPRTNPAGRRSAVDWFHSHHCEAPTDAIVRLPAPEQASQTIAA